MTDKDTPDSRKEFAAKAVRNALRAVAKEDLAIKTFKVNAVAVLLDKDVKTLFNARLTRDEMIQATKTIHPLSLESLPYIDSQPAATYAALDLVKYLDRMALSPTLKKWERGLPQSYPGLGISRSFLGFQSWLSRCTATDLWPFAIQEDGRPMDFIAAMLGEQLGEDIQWLSIREFGELAAHTASQARADSEQQELEDLIKVPVKTKEPDRIDRWNQPGGPV